MHRIRERLKAMGKTHKDMADYVTERFRAMNHNARMTNVRVSEILSGKKPFKALEIPQVAAFLGWTGQQMLDVIAESVQSSGASSAKIMPVDAAWGPNTLGVRQAEDIGGGFFSLSDKEVEKTPNVAQLLDVPSGFAMYMVTTDMEPKYEMGQMLYVNPTRPAAPGEYALLISVPDENGIRKYAVRKMVDILPTHYRCRQLSPDKTSNFSRKEWERAVKIMSSRER